MIENLIWLQLNWLNELKKKGKEERWINFNIGYQLFGGSKKKENAFFLIKPPHWYHLIDCGQRENLFSYFVQQIFFKDEKKKFPKRFSCWFFDVEMFLSQIIFGFRSFLRGNDQFVENHLIENHKLDKKFNMASLCWKFLK